MPRSRSKFHPVYRVQAVGARLCFALFAAMSLDRASAFGGWLARWLGPFTKAHRIAANNLRRSLKYKKDRELDNILEAMWDNIGRTLGEYPHLSELMNDPSRIEIVDEANTLAQLRDDGIGALLVGLHSSNWELSTIAGFRAGLKQYHFYRAPNNPHVDRLIGRMRAAMHQEFYLPKGTTGARQAITLLKNHAHIGVLVDQKHDEGIAIPFFGRDAMTTTAPAAFARRYGVPIVAERVVRLKGARFRIYVEPVPVVRTDDRQADVAATTRQITALLENWVRQNPHQWFWVHSRWPQD